MQKSKMAVWGGLTNSCEKKRSEKQRRKGKIQASKCRECDKNFNQSCYLTQNHRNPTNIVSGERH